jgi:predicted SAM-dependent methyltransferase
MSEIIKLNIGAGGTKKDGFVSVDAFNKKADILAPANDTGFSDDSIDEIFSSHMIEHIDRAQLPDVLSHWYNILKKGGKVHILVPNAQLYLKEWLAAVERKDWEHLEGWGTRWIMGFEGKGTGMYHVNLFHPETLKRALEKIGFKVESCGAVPTRVKSMTHFEYRNNGDIECIAIK